jgi:hypothetical protein
MSAPSWDLVVRTLEGASKDKDLVIELQKEKIASLEEKIASLEAELRKANKRDLANISSWEGNDAASELVEAVLAWKQSVGSGVRYPKGWHQLQDRLSAAAVLFIEETPNAFELAVSKAKEGRAKRRKMDDLYVMSASGQEGHEQHVKIGRSGNVEQRRKDLSRLFVVDLDIVEIFPRAGTLENEAHELFGDKREAGEWFRVRAEEATRSIRELVALRQSELEREE